MTSPLCLIFRHLSGDNTRDAAPLQSRSFAGVDIHPAYSDGRRAAFELRQLLLFGHAVPHAQKSATAKRARETLRWRFRTNASMLLLHELLQSAVGFGYLDHRIASGDGL